MSQERRKEGWDWSGKAYHYFIDGRSLCRNWAFPDYTNMTADTGNAEPQREDCQACFRKLLKRREKLGVTKIL